MRALRTAGDALQTMPTFITLLRAIDVGGRTVRTPSWPPPRRPFSAARLRAVGALNSGFVGESLSAGDKKALMALRTEIDDFHVRGREVFWLCMTRQCESEFSNAVLERTLRLRATFRGANTIARLAAKYPTSRGAA